MTDVPPGLEPLDPTTAVVGAGGVRTAIFDDEAVLYHAGLSEVLLLNSTGSVVWQCLDGEVTLHNLSMELADVYEVPVEEVRHEVCLLAANLVQRGFAVETS